MKLNKVKFSFLALAAFIFLLLGFRFFPLPYVVESPGPIENVNTFVSIPNKTDSFKGSFNITTVSMRKATIFDVILSKLNLEPYSDIYTEKEILGDQSSVEYEEMNKFFMVSSQNAAKVQALKLAGQESKAVFKGVYVMNIDAHSKFIKDLAIGDIITKIDGKEFKNSSEMLEYIKKMKVGQDLTIFYERNGKTRKVTRKLIKLPSTNRAGIGISLVDHTEIESKTPINYDAFGITGPSGGLILTLETYTKLTQKDIRHGQKIAGTGTMDFVGNVGRIGGIDKKVVSASRLGCDIFFAPDDTLSKEIKEADPSVLSNYQEAVNTAKKLKTKMKIIPVKTVQDALKYLEDVKNKK